MATHGSLTKAGKVRGQTPKVEGRKHVGTSSSLRNKGNFKKRFTFQRSQIQVKFRYGGNFKILQIIWNRKNLTIY